MANGFPDHPLTEADLAEINRGLDAVKAAKAQIALATRAGIDMSAQLAAANDAETRLIRVKQTYFPNR